MITSIPQASDGQVQELDQEYVESVDKILRETWDSILQTPDEMDE